MWRPWSFGELLCTNSWVQLGKRMHYYYRYIKTYNLFLPKMALVQSKVFALFSLFPFEYEFWFYFYFFYKPDYLRYVKSEITSSLIRKIYMYFLLRFAFVYQKSLRWTFNTCFWLQNNHLNLCSRVVNSQRVYCSKKLDEMFILKLSVLQNIIFII